MEFWIKAAQLILSLSILIVLHELGHFIPAKLFKTRVEKFYLFFDAGFSLFKIKKGETEYGIGWIPLGGYVKISGMIDESMDKEALAKPPEPWEFRSKPVWQRLIIMIGGVTVNVILGFVIYTGILTHWGEDFIPAKNATYGMHVDPVLEGVGFVDGDQLLKLDGVEIEKAGAIAKDLMLGEIKTVTINRNNKMIDLDLPENFGQLMLDSGLKGVLPLRFPSVIDSLMIGGNAEKAGFMTGDSIVGIDGQPMNFFNDIAKYITSHEEENVAVEVIRNGQSKQLSVLVSEDGKIGFYPKSISHYFDTKHHEYTFFEAIPRAVDVVKEKISDYVYSLRFLFSKSGIKQVGSFGTFGNMYAPTWDWHIFWERTAWFSLILAVMNILPIPALDGGHVMFLIYEMITGKPPKEKFLERAQMIGMILLLSLMVWAIGLDVWRFVFN